MQQPSFQKWGFARAKRQGPWCLLFLWCAPCWWLGLRIGVFSRQFRESSAKEWAKVKVHFEFWWPRSLAKNCLISNNLSWEGDSVMLAACLQGCEEVIRDNFVWFGRWWMNLHERSCCSTCFPRKNMKFAKDSRNIFFIREEWPFPEKGWKRNFDHQPSDSRSSRCYTKLAPTFATSYPTFSCAYCIQRTHNDIIIKYHKMI